MPLKLENRRRHTRITLTGTTGAALRGINSLVEGRVLDISLGGARIAMAESRRGIAGLVELTVGQFQAAGDIVWSADDEVGIRFRDDQSGAPAAVFEHVILTEFQRAAPQRPHIRFAPAC